MFGFGRGGSPSRPVYGFHPPTSPGARRSAPTNNLPVIYGEILLGAQLEPTGRRQPFHTALVRFDSTGALDTTFGNGGTVSVPAVGGCSALAVLSTGEILVVNANDIA